MLFVFTLTREMFSSVRATAMLSFVFCAGNGDALVPFLDMLATATLFFTEAGGIGRTRFLPS